MAGYLWHRRRAIRPPPAALRPEPHDRTPWVEIEFSTAVAAAIVGVELPGERLGRRSAAMPEDGFVIEFGRAVRAPGKE